MAEGKLLGIDHGIKRIGIAVCDALRFSARELTIIQRTSKIEDFEQINLLAQEEDVVGFVIGLPLNEGSDLCSHSQADTVRLWVERFSKTTRLPIVLWDERLSSEGAKALAIRQHRNPFEPIDDLAARMILQSYLDALHDGLISDAELI